jgi:hypothetical protein
MDDVEEGAQPIDLEQLARQRAGEVEPEAVDVHVEHPVPQAVHNQLQHCWAPHVQRVPAAGEIHVVARVVADQPVVRRVVDPFERQRRAQVIALCSVVVDHVEDDLEPRGVQRAHHPLELAHAACRCIRCRQPSLRREVADGVVAPVVRQPLFFEMPIGRVVMHRHQLHCRDADSFQVVDRVFRRQRFVGAAQTLRNVRVALREPAHVHLVDDRVVPRRARRPIVAPRERGIHDGREGRQRGVVARVHGEVFITMAHRCIRTSRRPTGSDARPTSRMDP